MKPVTNTETLPEFLSIKEQIIEEGHRFVRNISFLEKCFLREGRNIPTAEEKGMAATAFWELNDAIEAIIATTTISNRAELKKVSRESVSCYFNRCLPINRAIHRPYGYPGDFAIIELLYQLEDNAGQDPYISGVSNCLDYVISTIPSVQSLWESRRWLAGILKRKKQQHKPFRVLDVACGGARYIKDFLDNQTDTSNIEITLLDQEPAALNYAKDQLLQEHHNIVQFVNMPISGFRKAFTPGKHKYDLIISAGLFDYLNNHTAKNMIEHFNRLLSDRGAVALTNYSAQDYSAFSMEWFANWKLILRNTDEIMSMFPYSCTSKISLSRNRSLILALWEKQLH